MSTRHRPHSLRRPLRRKLFASLSGCLFAFLTCGTLHGQIQPYADYPQTRGKVEALKWDALPSWVTLDMEIRLRTEQQSAYSYTPGSDRIYELTRVRGAFTVRPTSWLKGYMQFHDTHALGLPLHLVASNMRDTFDLRQGYLTLHPKETVELTAGRKELWYGNERIIGISDFTNNSRTWDGFFGHLGGKNNVDLFSTSVVTIHPTSLDKHGAGLTFHGVYGTIGTWIPQARLQPFVLVRTQPRVESQQGIYGSETEATFGVQTDGKLPLKFDYDVTADLQRGSYSSDSIHAGADIVKLAYLAEHLPWKPRIGGEYDYATGNPHRNPYRVSTYDQQYPSNHNAFGLFDLFGFQNIKQQRVNLDLGPSKNISLLIQGEAIGVASRFDSVYNGSASVIVKPPMGGFATNSIGAAFDISGKYLFHDYWVFNGGTSHFFPDSLMAANKHGAPLTYSYFSITYRFKVDKQ